MTRRTLLGLIVAGGSALVAAVVGIPALILGLSPVLKQRPRELWRRLGRLDEFIPGEVRQAQPLSAGEAWPGAFSGASVFVWRPSADAGVVVFSRSCTDLGCPLDYDPGSACFLCPCHGGIFDREGRRLAGPTDRPMYRFVHRVREGVLEIDLASLPPGV